MDSILGQWKYDMPRCPGILEMFISYGFPKEQCTEENMAKSVISIEKDGGSYNYSLDIPGFPKKVNKYTPGQTLPFENPLGAVFKTTIKEEGGNVVETMVDPKSGSEMVTVREANGNEMKLTSTFEGQTIVAYLVKA